MQKISFSSGEQIQVSSVVGRIFNTRGQQRDSLEFKILPGPTYTQLHELFSDGAVFTIVTEVPASEPAQQNTEPVIQSNEYTNYIIAGGLTDHCDGSFTAIMSQETENEKLAAENAALLLAQLEGLE